MKKCPYCAEEIQDEAKKCRFCGEWLGMPAPAPKVNLRHMSETGDIMEQGTVFPTVGELVQLQFTAIKISEHVGLIDGERPGLTPPRPRWDMLTGGPRGAFIIDALPKGSQAFFWRERVRSTDYTESGPYSDVLTVDIRVRWMLEKQLAELTYVVYHKSVSVDDE